MKTNIIMGSALGILLILVSACGGTSSPSKSTTQTSAYSHYSDTNFGFSFDYPSNWQINKLGQGEMVVQEKGSQTNQIQIGVYPGKPNLKTLPNEIKAQSMETIARDFVKSQNGTDFKLIKNSSPGNIWDWEISYSFSKGSNSMVGTDLLRETDNVAYYVSIFHTKNSSYAEGYSVIESFKMRN